MEGSVLVLQTVAWRKKVEASEEWDGVTLVDHNELLAINPSLAAAEEIKDA